MNPEVVAYLKNLKPQLDVLGQWMYLPNARTGSTSITGGLLGDRVIMHHRGAKNWGRVWDQVIEPRLDNLFIFTQVRNPWDRAVSGWALLGGRNEKWLPFDAFVKQGGLDDPDYEHFFAPQAPNFMMGNTRIEEIFVAMYEDLDSDWRYIARRLGIDLRLPHRNASNHEYYTTYYDDECVLIVGEKYAVEIAELDYKFGQ